MGKEGDDEHVEGNVLNVTILILLVPKRGQTF